VDRTQNPSSPRKAGVPHLRNQKNDRAVIAVGVAWFGFTALSSILIRAHV
jgi:hypothetical protein